MTDDDPRYGTCSDCGKVGYEVEPCTDCGADICSFCCHDECPEREAMTTAPFDALPDGSRTALTGTLTTWQRHISHQGNPHGTGTILTLAGPVEINVFAKPYATFGHLIAEGEVREWTGIVDLREGALLSVRSVAEVGRDRT